MKKVRLLIPLIILMSLFYTYDLNGGSSLNRNYIHFIVYKGEKEGITGVEVNIKHLYQNYVTDSNGRIKVKKSLFKDGQKIEITLENHDKDLVCYDEDTGKEVKNIIFTIDFSSKAVMHIALINKESLEYRSKEISLKDKINKLEEEVETKVISSENSSLVEIFIFLAGIVGALTFFLDKLKVLYDKLKGFGNSVFSQKEQPKVEEKQSKVEEEQPKVEEESNTEPSESIDIKALTE